MDAISFIKMEHKKIKKTFGKITKSPNEKTKKKIFKLLSKDLITHETMEEKLFYPHLRKNTQLINRVKHLISEEKMAEKMIKKFNKDKSSEKWKKQFVKFKNDVLKHAKEEETKLFPKVRKAIEKNELNKLGKRFRTFVNNRSTTYL